MGTSLQLHQNSSSDWSVHILRHDPEKILFVYKKFLGTGVVDILTTTTYGIDTFRMNDFRMLHDKAIRLANEAIYRYGEGRKILVAGSVSCYGASLENAQEFSGDYVDDETIRDRIIEFHRRKIEVFVDAIREGQVQILLFETTPVLKEAMWIAEAFEMVVKEHKELQTVDRIMSFTCKNARETYYGDRIEDCASFVEKSSAFTGLSVNCTDPRCITPLFQRIHQQKQTFSKLLMTYPNSGQEYDKESDEFKDTEFSVKEGRFRQVCKEWYDLGVSVIGGCCTTTTQDLVHVDEVLRR